MRCGKSTVADPSQIQNVQAKWTAEKHAFAELQLLRESIDMDSDNTVDRNELQMAFQKNDKLGALIVQATLNLKQAATEQFKHTTVEEKAKARLRDVFYEQGRACNQTLH